MALMEVLNEDREPELLNPVRISKVFYDTRRQLVCVELDRNNAFHLHRSFTLKAFKNEYDRVAGLHIKNLLGQPEESGDDNGPTTMKLFRTVYLDPYGSDRGRLGADVLDAIEGYEHQNPSVIVTAHIDAEGGL